MKGKLARLAHGVPERPAPRCARARLPAISRALLASPAPAGARARAPHCCAHRPAARSTQPRIRQGTRRSSCLSAPPRARERGSPRSTAPSPHPLQRARVPSLLRTPPLGTHATACVQCSRSRPPVSSSARARLPTSHRHQQPAPPCAPLTSATHSTAPSSHPWAPSRYTRAEP
jgi:hypothetical protein